MNSGRVPLKAWIGFISLSGGTFMAVLDTQIVASSLPVIGASLGSTLQEASWIQTAYMIAEVIMIPLAGWLSRSLSLRYLYAVACSLFTVSSVLCAVSSSMEWMVTFRVFQGLCAGFMTPLLYQAIYVLFPPEKRSAATLFVVFIISLAPVIGPTLGGWITDTWTWRWLFLINVVPGVLVTASVLGLVRGPKPQLHLLKLCDGYGIVLAALFLGPLEYVIGEGPDRDWFESSLIVFLTCIACTSALLFLWRQLACRHPLVDLRAFLYRNFSTGCLFNFAVGFGLFGSGYLMTIFLSGVKKYNSMQIGHVMAVPGAAMILSIPLVRMVRKHAGGNASLAIGLAMFTTALWLNSAMTSETGFDQLFLPQVLRGMGIMFTLSPITELALGTLPRDAVANATGLYTLMRSLGGGIGIAVINTLVDMRSSLHFQRLAETLTPARAAVTDYLDRIDASLAAYLPEMENAQRGLRQVAGLVRREALIITCSEMWLVIAGVFSALLLLLPVVKKVQR